MKEVLEKTFFSDNKFSIRLLYKLQISLYMPKNLLISVNNVNALFLFIQKLILK